MKPNPTRSAQGSAADHDAVGTGAEALGGDLFRVVGSADGWTVKPTPTPTATTTGPSTPRSADRGPRGEARVEKPVDPSRREALVGYRIFQPEDRGRGIGSAALGALIDWARSSGELDSVVAIARSDNEASRRLAERAGFSHIGAAREDAGRVVYRKLLTADP